MQVKVTKENVFITQGIPVNEGELLVNECKFDLPQCFDGLTVTAMFNNIPVPLTGENCYIPSLKAGTAVLGVYAYRESDGGVQLMYSPKPASFYVNKGSYTKDVNVEEIPAISEFEKYCAAITSLTFPKSDVINNVDMEKEYTDTQVYSAKAVNDVFLSLSDGMTEFTKTIDNVMQTAEFKDNKTTSISAESTDEQYPTAKAVYLCLLNQANALNEATAELCNEIKHIDEGLSTLSQAHGIMRDDITALDNNMEALSDDLTTVTERVKQSETRIEETELLAVSIVDNVERNSQTIAENHTKTQIELSDRANALKATAYGQGVIRANDVSPIEHTIGISLKGEATTDFGGTQLKISGKNLASVSGCVVSGSNGYSQLKAEGILLPSGEYVASVDYSQLASTARVALSVRDYDDLSKVLKTVLGNSQSGRIIVPFTVGDDSRGVQILLYANADAELLEVSCNFTKLQVEAGTTATEYSEFTEYQDLYADADGRVTDALSRYPVTTVLCFDNSADVEINYNKDINTLNVLSDNPSDEVVIEIDTSVFANALEGSATSQGELVIDDVSPVAHQLSVTLSGDENTDVTGLTVQCGGKNLYGLEGRTLADFNTTGHTFTGNNLFLSVAGSNYYYSNRGSYTYDPESESVTYTCTSGWFGLGADIKVEPNTNYCVSAESIDTGFAVVASFYDADGQYISYVSNLAGKSFETPANAEWMIVILAGTTKNTTGTFKKVQVEKGDEITGYQKYILPQLGAPDSNGCITGLESIYPQTIITATDPTVSIKCVYRKDINKAFEKLQNAIIALGGTV